METLLLNTLNGLSWGMLLFLIAVGLTTVFGVMGVLNFAHGSLFMLGAYLCMQSMQYFESFWLGLLIGPLCVAIIGVLVEKYLLKRVYGRDVSYQLLLTFAILLILDDGVRMIWGSGYHIVDPPAIFSGIISIAGQDYPVYRIFLIVIGPIIGTLLWSFFHFSKWGKIIRAASFDNIMAEGVGINVPMIYTAVFALGAWLAALGGALAAPQQSLIPSMGEKIIIESFIVVVIGGMGSFPGAFVGALLLGLLGSFGTVFAGNMQMVIPIYWTMILSEILIMGLMAISFNLLLGYTGLLSFGQGAFFGLGAYSAALMLQGGYENLFLILLVGMLVAMLASLVVGFFSVQLDEIFFAMITLGFGMLFFSVAHNWLDVTGGSDGLPVFSLPSLNLFGFQLTFYAPVNMYYLVFVLVFIGCSLLWLIVHSPFGLVLKALRENKQRVSFIGGNVKLLRIAAFAISGAFTGLAGVLFCLFNNMATPEFMHWSFSAKPVIMSIIGGSGVFLGPLFGAAIFFFLEQVIIQFTENWMFFLGLVLVFIVLFFPEGVFGTLRNKFFKQGSK